MVIKVYCKLYIHSSSIESIISIFERQYGAARKEFNNYYFKQLDIHICRNKEADINKLRTYPDGFLYYEIIADVDIYDNHIQITDTILRLLWQNNMPSVVSCDYEGELNNYIFRL